MKKENRVKLYCCKKLQYALDSFFVIVSKGDKENAKKMYQGMGYEVKEC